MRLTVATLALLSAVMVFVPATAQTFEGFLREGLGALQRQLNRQQQTAPPAPPSQPEPTLRSAPENGSTDTHQSEMPVVQSPPRQQSSPPNIELTMEIQGGLNELGYDAGTVDGAYGPQTRRAIVSFQRDHGLREDGLVSPELAQALRESTISKQAMNSGSADAPSTESRPTLLKSASTGQEPDTSISPRDAEMTLIPPGLLVLKFHPDYMDENQLLNLARRQVAVDQHGYERPDPDHVFMFSEEQVSGRAIDFAARERLSEYKREIIRWASRVPLTLTVKRPVKLNFFTYAGGKLRSADSSRGGQGSDVLFRYSMLSEHEKLKLPPLGSRAIPLSGIPQLWADIHDARFPETIRDLRVRKQAYFALDRRLVFPPIELDASIAEKLWQRPTCSISATEYVLNRNMAQNKAEAAAVACQQERTGYIDALTFSYDVEVQDVVLTETAWILKAKLLGGNLFGTRGELLHHFDATAFEPGVDSWSQRQEKLESERQAKLVARQKKRTSLKEADVLGIRLDMRLSEAEKVVRERMDVAHVIESTTSKDRPFLSDFRAFFNADRSETIVLFQTGPEDDSVAAVARILHFETPMEVADLKTQLSKKYGPPTQNLNRSDYIMDWISSAPQKTECFPRIVVGADRVPIPFPAFTESGARYGGVPYESMAANCEPTILAEIHPTSLTVFLHDLGAHARNFLEREKEKLSAQEPAKKLEL